jgi:hypothetical protein
MRVKALERNSVLWQPKQSKAPTKANATDSETTRIAQGPHKILGSGILHLRFAQEEEGGSISPHKIAELAYY